MKGSTGRTRKRNLAKTSLKGAKVRKIAFSQANALADLEHRVRVLKGKSELNASEMADLRAISLKTDRYMSRAERKTMQAVTGKLLDKNKIFDRDRRAEIQFLAQDFVGSILSGDRQGQRTSGRLIGQAVFLATNNAKLANSFCTVLTRGMIEDYRHVRKEIISLNH